MKLLENKVAIVIGASSGIGRSIALIFADHGPAIVLTSRRLAPLEEVAVAIRENGGRATIIEGNVGIAETH